MAQQRENRPFTRSLADLAKPESAEKCEEVIFGSPPSPLPVVMKEQLVQHQETMDRRFEQRMGEVETKLDDLRNVLLEFAQTGAQKTELYTGPSTSGVLAGTQSCIKVPDFDGTVAWRVYLAQFERIAVFNGWSLERRAAHLTAALRGPALDVLSCVSDECSFSYQSLVSSLEQRFGDTHQGELHRTELRTRVRRARETLRELAMDVERLTNLAYPTGPVDFRARLACDYFIDALHDTDMQMAVRQAKPAKLSDALSVALEFESLSKSLKSAPLRRIQTNEFYTHQANGPTTNSEPTVKETLSTVLSRLEELELSVRRIGTSAAAKGGNKKLDVGPCWNCNQMGHYRRDCGQSIKKPQPKKYARQGNE